MGTFIIRPAGVVPFTDNLHFGARIGGVDLAYPPSEAERLQAVQEQGPGDSNGLFVEQPTTSSNAQIGFEFLSQNCIYLNGSPTPVGVGDLPSPFNITECAAILEVYMSGATVDSYGELRQDGNSIGLVTNGSGTIDVDQGTPDINDLLLTTIAIHSTYTNTAGSRVVCSEPRYEGVYSEEFTFTLTPSGGNVEPGQSITVEGPGAAGLEYAATNGDKVIPLDPKVVDPDTVILEVPNPSTDPCVDCLGDCVECEDCFDACNEDLTSAACEECMAACLECLEGCLEDLEAAEECQESKQDPPNTPTNIVIICGGPGFDGSVPLGTFTIIVANGSGIYEFVEGKTNDTLYSTARDGSTYDVRIPTPSGKTGFFRS